MGPADAFPVGETQLQPLAASAIGRQPDYTHPSSSIVHYSLPREMSVDEIRETVVRFAPPLTITKDLIDGAITTFREILRAVEAAG